MSRLRAHHELRCDVLVAGGGAAGVPCALAAARNGAKVILCQDRSVLGGNASSEVRMHIVGADISGGRGVELQTEAREGGIIEEIRLENAARNPQRSASMMDLILYELCRAEPNLTLMLNTTVVAANLEADRIVSIDAVRESTEDAYTIAAKIFIDCTGDGRLAAEAGCPFRWGREATSEFNEPLAQKEKDNYRLGSTLLFQARDMGRPMPFIPPPWIRKFKEEDLKFRGHGSWEYGYWWVEWGGMLDTIKQNEHIRDELLGVMLGVWDHIKNGGKHPTSKNWALTWFGFLPGKRESRRFIGMHTLTQHDLGEARDQPDAIAFGGWSFDTHPPAGIDASNQKPCDQPRMPHLFSIPLRSCMTAKPKNLMFAGRNASATHVAFASTRVMATCGVMGQGAGTAAAIAVARGPLPSELVDDPAYIQAVQQQLLKDDCFLIGIKNNDPKDLAPKANVTASSHQKAGDPKLVISGVSRAVFGKGGVRKGLAARSTNRWMSDPKAPLPASLTLTWPDAVLIGQVRLVFDTGQHRPLTLSHQDNYVKRMVWAPQPETIRDYEIRGQSPAGTWETILTVKNNYQRLRIHHFEHRELKALQIIAHKTNGLNHARLNELRCYGP